MTTVQTKPKFVLIDPSFDGKAGDKWQYAMAFYDSAMRNDFDFILLAHKSSPFISAAAGRTVDQRNVFAHNFYGHGDIRDRAHNTPKRQALKAADARTNARLQALEAEIRDRRNENRTIEEVRLTELKTQMIADHLQATSVLIEEIQRDEPQPFNRDDFAEAMIEQIKSLSLKKGDILFLHTTTQGMLESLTEICARLDNDETIDVDAYFLFHFGAEAPDARTFIDRYYSYSHFDSLKLRLSTGSPFRRVHLIATSEILRDELEKFIGLPVGLFDGLCNPDRYLMAVGGPASFQSTRATVMGRLAQSDVTFGLRAADLDDERFEVLLEAVDGLVRAGFNPTIRIGYHDANWPKASDFARRSKDRFQLVSTNENDDYIRFLVESAIVLLPYRREIYQKRVSAVLHDCAIMGISTVVPRGTTLADGGDFADIYEYADLDDLPDCMLRAARTLIADPSRSSARQARADALFGSDVITRLLKSTSEPSITVDRRGPIATVIMPMWGRVGSTCIFDAQIRFLLNNGYFVVQLFSFDKPTDIERVSEYFWRMLFESSQSMRGSVQRIAYRLEDFPVEKLPPEANAYDAYEANFSQNSLWDDQLTALTRRSTVTVVNHVFNTQLARAIGGGQFILESHDIQSIQMVKWPLRNPFTGAAESFDRLLSREMRSIATYDYVVNISSTEHALLKYANPKARVITPYVSVDTRKPKYESISTMGYAHNWNETFHGIFKLDLLLLGDAHPANVESGVWFIENVFRPHLSGRGIKVAIVGRLSWALKDRLGDIPDVFYCGFVDDINSIRYLTRVAILADQRGSGISIKTLETLAYGGAFVATSVAFRGFDDLLSEAPPVHDKPSDFANRVIELLQNEETRADLERWGAKAYHELASQEVFDGAWQEVFRHLGLPTQ